MTLKAPLRCTSRTGSSSSGVMLWNALSRRMPALEMTMSTRPNASSAVATIAWPPSGVATESALATAVPPRSSTSLTVRSAGPAEAPVPSLAPPRSLTTTLAPREASSRACSRPRPPPAPVTIATLSSKRMSPITSPPNASMAQALLGGRGGSELPPHGSGTAACQAVRDMGPLQGTKVVELAGIGPGPFCAMLLADLGAEVLAVDRPEAERPGWPALFGRGRQRVAVDLKHPDGPGLVLDLVAGAGALVEGFRPGVAERLGIGPEACLARNPRLVYGRVTGWGQDGPLAGAAGHDIDYIALAGALHPIGPAAGPPVPPLNLLGDFGGGGMLLALGVVAALLEAARSGQGQVVDAAMADGAALLTTQLHELLAAGLWTDRRGANLLDGAAPFYTVYETADGRHLAVGALEPQFWAELLERVGLATEALPGQHDRAGWPLLRGRLAAVFRTRTREEWCRLLEGTDACVAPVLSLLEAPAHPHNRARATFVDVGGSLQPAPAPRFSRTPCATPEPPPAPGKDDARALAAWGLDPEKLARLH